MATRRRAGWWAWYGYWTEVSYCEFPPRPLLNTAKEEAYANYIFTCLKRSIALVLFVSRSKLVPDFALTAHGVHLAVVTFYTGLLPRHALWWLTMAASSAASVTLGMWGCRRRELAPISFGGRPANGDNGGARPDPPTGSGGGATADGPGADEEVGFARGRGRGRGRDGAGDYEMVQMPDERDGGG